MQDNENGLEGILRMIVKGIGILVAVGVFLWTESNTLWAASEIFPGDVFRQWLSVVIFGLGMIYWIASFVYESEGVAQRSTSLIAGGLNVLFVIALSGFVLALSSGLFNDQSLTMRQNVVWLVELATAFQIIAGVVHFVASPKNLDAIQYQNELDKIHRLTVKKTQEKMQTVADSLANTRAQMMQKALEQRIHDQDIKAGLVSSNRNGDNRQTQQKQEFSPPARDQRTPPPAQPTLPQQRPDQAQRSPIPPHAQGGPRPPQTPSQPTTPRPTPVMEELAVDLFKEIGHEVVLEKEHRPSPPKA